MLDSLITLRTSLKMLFKFFINTANKSYLNGLANEFNNSTNSIRKELNNLKMIRIVARNFNIIHPGYVWMFNDINKIDIK